MRILLFCTLMLAGACLFSQNNCQTTLSTDGIYLRSDFWNGTTYVKNDKKYKVGFLNKKLGREFQPDTRPYQLYKKSREMQIANLIISGICLGTSIYGLNKAFGAIDSDGNLKDETTYTNGMLIVLASTGFSLGTSITIGLKSRQLIEEAVWERNKALFGQ